MMFIRRTGRSAKDEESKLENQGIKMGYIRYICVIIKFSKFFFFFR